MIYHGYPWIYVLCGYTWYIHGYTMYIPCICRTSTCTWYMLCICMVYTENWGSRCHLPIPCLSTYMEHTGTYYLACTGTCNICTMHVLVHTEYIHIRTWPSAQTWSTCLSSLANLFTISTRWACPAWLRLGCSSSLHSFHHVSVCSRVELFLRLGIMPSTKEWHKGSILCTVPLRYQTVTRVYSTVISMVNTRYIATETYTRVKSHWNLQYKVYSHWNLHMLFQWYCKKWWVSKLFSSNHKWTF